MQKKSLRFGSFQKYFAVQSAGSLVAGNSAQTQPTQMRRSRRTRPPKRSRYGDDDESDTFTAGKSKKMKQSRDGAAETAAIRCRTKRNKDAAGECFLIAISSATPACREAATTRAPSSRYRPRLLGCLSKFGVGGRRAGQLWPSKKRGHPARLNRKPCFQPSHSA